MTEYIYYIWMCVLILTNIWDVKWKPVQESVADQFCEQQTERELHHSLWETQNTMKACRGAFLSEIRTNKQINTLMLNKPIYYSMTNYYISL